MHVEGFSQYLAQGHLHTGKVVRKTTNLSVSENEHEAKSQRNILCCAFVTHWH